MGLVNRVVPKGHAVAAALELGRLLSSFPQTCLRHDRLSALEQWGMSEDDAMLNEVRHGLAVLASGEAVAGAARFADGEGRNGA